MKKKIKKISITLLLIFVFIFICGASFFIGGVFLSTDNVHFDKEKLILSNSKITMYDSNGEPLIAYADNKKTAKIGELNEYTKNAFISIEDKNFYSHKGVNVKRMVKALINNLKSGYIVEGASTISQQLIKNTHLKNEKTLKRKLKEIMLTMKLESVTSKNDILETYLNIIYFGNSNYGIESASKNYFGVEAKDLSISQSATLAGIIKSPNTYSPITNVENCKNRRNLVLREMKKDGYISNEEYETAINEDLVTVSSQNEQSLKYIEGAIYEASKILNISEKSISEYGYKIYTYLDSKENDNLEKNIINNEKYYHKNSYGNTPNSQVIIMDKLGHIIAFGGKSNQNLNTLKRSPASTIKPILCYAPAMEKNLISPASIIKDEKININNYSPNNVGNTFSGNVSVRYAIEKSLNIPSVKVLQMVGIENAKKFANKVGIEFSKTDNNYALALGSMTNGVNFKNLVGSYTIFANNGNYSKPTFIKKIEDNSGRLLYINNDITQNVISDTTSYLMTDILKSATKTGTSKKLKDLPFEVAGKTGTQGIKNTNLNTDIYSIGYTSEHIVGVWLGNPTGDNKFNLEGENNGGTYPTIMLKDTLLHLYENHKPNNFTIPDSVEKVDLDSIMLKEGKLAIASSNTPDIYKTSEIFSKTNIANLPVSSLFNSCTAPKINCKLSDNKITINFDTIKSYKYYLYKELEDQTTLLLQFNGTGKNEEFIDTNIESDSIYSYFVKCEINNPLEENKLSDKSEKVRVLT